jgi:hypothetical protein
MAGGRTTRSIWLACLLGSMTVAVAGCQASPPRDPEIESIAQPLYRKDSPWPASADGFTRIPVCFRTSGRYQPAEETRQRNLVRDSIAASWGRWSNVLFQGFGECSNPPANATLAIKLTDLNPLGQLQNGGAGDIPDQSIHPGGRRGFQGVDTPTFGWLALNGVADRHAWAVTVHEIGHALSFEHEQSRPDSPGFCPLGDALIPGGALLTPYDDMSTMNYCVPVDFGRISWQDIAGVQAQYGTSTAGRWLKTLPSLSHLTML